jgi:hypothetical protein
MARCVAALGLAMKCEGCGAELAANVKSCTACGRPVGIGQRAGAETMQVAQKTEQALGKVGRGLVGGVKGMAAGAKKGFKGEEEKKE